MKRAYYADTLAAFLDAEASHILGQLAAHSTFSVEPAQRDAWLDQIRLLKPELAPYRDLGSIYFEYSIPRLGKRIDVVALVGPALFVIEFKVGESEFHSYALDQVWDYALDLKNFHESSHNLHIAPVLVATNAKDVAACVATTLRNDRLLLPIRSSVEALPEVIRAVLDLADGPAIVRSDWEAGRYCPTPTIIEAAMALYSGHSVADISRSDASAINLSRVLRPNVRVSVRTGPAGHLTCPGRRR